MVYMTTETNYNCMINNGVSFTQVDKPTLLFEL